MRCHRPAPHIFFYLNDDSSWLELQKVAQPDRNGADFFGSSVAIEDDFAVIGAERDSDDEMGEGNVLAAGSIYTFQLQEDWGFNQKIVLPE